MQWYDELDLLDQAQADAEAAADTQALTGVDRRQFVFLSLTAAAATTFGFGAKALAQAPAVGGQAPQQPALSNLGNGEEPSWTFMPYPQGTGALMEKLINEQGAAAFKRATFVVEPWTGPVPTDPEALAYLPAHRISALIKAKKITSTQITKIYLERMKRLNSTLLCAVTILEARALEYAAQMDKELAAGKYRGPLHGVPYGVKDLFAVKGTPTTWGSADFENRIIDVDAEVTVRLREAGAVLLAKLATGLFAGGDNWFRGQTKDPWDTRRGSSGSSAGPSSATAAGCVAFGIGTETSGSIVSPSTTCGLSALRPTYGRVSRHGGMVLAWSQDRVGPITRTVEDAAMVFNTIHGVDPKDNSTVTTPFHFDRNIKLSSLRIGLDDGAPKEFVEGLRKLGATFKPIGPRPAQGGGGFGVEGAAAFDFYVQMKAKELGIDVASIPEPPANAGRGGGGGGRGGVAPAGAPGGAPGGAPADPPGRPSARAAMDRWTRGRFVRALDFIQGQRQRQILITQMQELLKDFDMYLPGAGNDVGLHSQTGHPCAVVQYKFDSPPAGRGGGPGRGGDTTPPVVYNKQPLCAVIAGNLYNDDKILSVAHQFQINSDWHNNHPKI